MHTYKLIFKGGSKAQGGEEADWAAEKEAQKEAEKAGEKEAN